MRNAIRVTTAAGAMVMLSAISSADRLHQPLSSPAPQQQASVSPGEDVGAVPPYAIVVNNNEVEGIVGKEVRSITDEKMGRIIEVVVDALGRVRAAVIDFGGFLGVGNRKIAVDWNLLQFDPGGNSQGRVTLKLTPDQVRSAPEYKNGKPVVIVGALGDPPASPYAHSAREW